MTKGKTMELLNWLEERAANCRRIADTRHGADRAGWIEDETYFRLAVTAIDQCTQMRWRDVSEELPQEAQEVLFVRDGKTVHGAWIGGIFWHSNQMMAAAKWMPLPFPPNADVTGLAPAREDK